MFQFHVSCGISKKILGIEEDDFTKDKLREKISESFKINPATIIAIQVYQPEWDDWLDMEDELPPTKSKLQVVVADQKATTSQAASAEDVQEEQPSLVEPEPSTSNAGPSTSNAGPWHLSYVLPTMPCDVTRLLKASDPAVLSRKWRTKIIQVLYEDVIQYTLYPSSQQYNEVSRAIVRKFPFLQDRAHNASGYDTWKESLRNKFKHERAPLTDEGVLKCRGVFGHKRQKQTGEKAPSPVKKAKRSSLEHEHPGEDERSIKKHVEDLKLLSARRNPDVAVIADKMERTRHHRQKMITECSVAAVLEQFPILRSEIQLLKELQCSYGGKDVYKCLQKTVASGGQEIIKHAETISACKNILELYGSALENANDKEEQELTVTACCLLIPLLMAEKDLTYVIDKEPIVRTPTLVIKGNPFTTEDLAIKMDGIVVCTTSSIPLGVSATFAAFYVYGVEYPRQGKNTLLFYQQHLARLNQNKSLPAKVQRFINAITIIYMYPIH